MAHGIKKPHAPDSIRHKLWTSMRIMRGFTVADLMAVAEASESSVTAYLYPLRLAGFIRRTSVRGGHRRSHYQIVRNRGPLAPRDWRLERIVFDPNTDEEFSYE